jgi:hypothetical protein
VKYSERVAFFSNDYDSSNPLTKKKGEMRILQMRIDQTEDPTQKEAL